jgi:lipid II:glycine glycyltransferase (peptidoglycan interpeptide bridge formation enzyme)
MKDIRATIIIDLEGKTAEDLLKQADRSRRKNINKANSCGLIFKEADDSEWREYYKIYGKVWLEGGVNPEPMEKLKQHENYKLFVAKKDDKVLGGGLIELQEEGINFVAFASLIEFQDMRVNDFLYWNSILYALNNKKRYVDLGGYQLKARGHMRGINTFKEKWGGRIVMREVKGSLPYILGRKSIRNLPAARWLWDRVKGRPVSIKDKQLKERKRKEVI